MNPNSEVLYPHHPIDSTPEAWPSSLDFLQTKANCQVAFGAYLYPRDKLVTRGCASGSPPRNGFTKFWNSWVGAEEANPLWSAWSGLCRSVCRIFHWVSLPACATPRVGKSSHWFGLSEEPLCPVPWAFLLKPFAQRQQYTWASGSGEAS
jgi:hypothetical protein